MERRRMGPTLERLDRTVYLLQITHDTWHADQSKETYLLTSPMLDQVHVGIKQSVCLLQEGRICNGHSQQALHRAWQCQDLLVRHAVWTPLDARGDVRAAPKCHLPLVLRGNVVEEPGALWG